MPKLPTFKDGERYRVRLAKPVTVRGRVRRPSDSHVFKGKVCREIIDAIESAEKV